MRILSVVATNFGSYKNLAFEFQNQGLTLVSGPTGAGKSTLCDLIPWGLYGQTAKGGLADDVLSWYGGTTEVTVHLSIGAKEYAICRTRGDKANDLWYYEAGDVCNVRGKDLKDTQKQVNNLLGMDAETYLAGAYLHEFSLTSQFFTTTAKNRRQITEQLVDLAMAKGLQEKTSLFLKTLNEDAEGVSDKLSEYRMELQHTIKFLDQELARSKEWRMHQNVLIEDARAKSDNFEADKARTITDLQYRVNKHDESQATEIMVLTQQINTASGALIDPTVLEAQRAVLQASRQALKADVCKECGSRKDSHKVLLLAKEEHALELTCTRNDSLKREIFNLERTLKRTQEAPNPYEAKLEATKKSENHYETTLETLKNQVNPYKQAPILRTNIIDLNNTVEHLEAELVSINVDIADTELLSDITNSFRATLITRAITQLENSTNKLLEAHFDAELRVKFEANDNDKIDVEITKDGNLCSFTQLSKGQRQILTLAFGCSVLKAVSLHKGISFNAIFFDEVLSGLSDTMKAQAFTLLEAIALEHESVFVVDHSENFKSLFHSTIHVTLGPQGSEIEQD